MKKLRIKNVRFNSRSPMWRKLHLKSRKLGMDTHINSIISWVSQWSLRIVINRLNCLEMPIIKIIELLLTTCIVKGRRWPLWAINFMMGLATLKKLMNMFASKRRKRWPAPTLGPKPITTMMAIWNYTVVENKSIWGKLILFFDFE